MGGGVLMYLLYLDDSGSPGNMSEDYFILGGFCIPENSIYWLTKKLDTLASEISPDDPGIVEFHASEIFRGKELPWNKFTKREDRVEIIKNVLLTLRDAYSEIVAFACAVHKPSYIGHDPVKMAFEDLCSRFDMYLNRIFHDRNGESHKGMIILDENSYEAILQKLALEFQELGTRWRDINDIVEVPLFVDSKASRLIQLADHVAYAVFRRYNAGDLNYFNCIENRFDTYQGVMHGLAHKQLYTQNCTCPACITRRSVSA